jgi:hypothetical protein
MLTHRFGLSAILLFTVTWCASAGAQSIWLPPATGSQVTVEAMKSVYDPSEGIAFLSTAWYMSGWVRLNPNLGLALEVPYSNYEEDGFDAQSTIGNPYVGVVCGSQDLRGWVVEAGGRIPILGEADFDENYAAMANGIATDVTRTEAFLPEVASVRIRAGGYAASNPQSGMVIRIMAGGSVWIPTSGGDSEFLGEADIALWRLDPKANVGAILSAKTLLTESDLSFTERSEFQLGVAGGLRFGQVEPGVHAHLPLSNEGLFGLGQIQDVVVGVNCTVHLSK